MSSHLHRIEETSPESDHRDYRKAAVAAIIGGSAIMGAAVVGILGNEARTPEEAVGSINMAGHTYFVETEEFPLIGLGAIGFLAVATGVEVLRNREEE